MWGIELRGHLGLSDIIHIVIKINIKNVLVIVVWSNQGIFILELLIILIVAISI